MKRKQLSLAVHGALAMSFLIGAPALAQDAAKGKDGERIDYTPTIRAELIDAWDGLEEALVLGHVNAMHATRVAVKNSGAPSATR